MLDFLKSYSFLFTTLVSSTIAITLYFKNKKKKQLSFDVYSWDTIVTKMNEDIKIYYKDTIEITDDLNMVMIKIRNTGNEPIKKDDFENDLFLKFTDSKVFDVSINETKPYGLDIEVYYDELESRVGIKPLLLNPKDEFNIKLLTNNLTPNFFVPTRIVGGSVVEYKKRQKRFAVKLEKITSVAEIAGAVVGFVIIILYAIWKFFYSK
ncbi:hypothetical protein [Priestia megaterium]